MTSWWRRGKPGAPPANVGCGRWPVVVWTRATHIGIMPLFTVVARARSTVLFGREDAFRFQRVPTLDGRVTVSLSTRRGIPAGFKKEVAFGICAVIEGEAPNLEVALATFVSAAETCIPIVTLCLNGATDMLEPEVGYESSPDVDERPFFQQFIPEERLLLSKRRRVQLTVLQGVASALMTHPDNERLLRALAHYHRALQEWRPGSEVVSVHHLWMAAECLTPVMLRSHLKQRGETRDTLASMWGIQPRELDASVRKRLVFRNEAGVYAAVRAAMDGFEHGFRPLREIHEAARDNRARTAQLVRTAILAELALEPTLLQSLGSASIAEPGHLHGAKYVRGTLNGGNGRLAADDQLFPIMTWASTIAPAGEGDGEEMPVSMSEKLTPRLAPGVTVRIGSIEVWGST